MCLDIFGFGRQRRSRHSNDRRRRDDRYRPKYDDDILGQRDSSPPRHQGSSHPPHRSHHHHRRKSVDTSPILFYERHLPYYEFTNFSPHTVRVGSKVYPTSEHAFQASKFIPHRPDLAERIRMTSSSREALQEATRLRQFQRSDWFNVNINVMDQVLEAKFTQHPELTRLLKSTGQRELVEDSPVDSFWGIGADKRGRNELGKSLMRLRAKL